MSVPYAYQLGEGEHLKVVGERIRILADSGMTSGRCAIFEEITAPAGGPPLHRHKRDDEFFYIAEGTVKFVVDGQLFTVMQGGCVYAPRGSIHTFVNASALPSRMIVSCFPGGIERAFREVDRLTHLRPVVTAEELSEAFSSVELEFLGPPLAVK